MRSFVLTLLGAAAAYLAARFLELRFNLGTIAALVIAAVGLAGLYRSWKPEGLFVALLVSMPLVGWAFADREWARVTLALFAVFAAIAFACALRRRHPGMFAGAASAALVAGAKLYELLS